MEEEGKGEWNYSSFLGVFSLPKLAPAKATWFHDRPTAWAVVHTRGTGGYIPSDKSSGYFLLYQITFLGRGNVADGDSCRKKPHVDHNIWAWGTQGGPSELSPFLRMPLPWRHTSYSWQALSDIFRLLACLLSYVPLSFLKSASSRIAEFIMKGVKCGGEGWKGNNYTTF